MKRAALVVMLMLGSWACGTNPNPDGADSGTNGGGGQDSGSTVQDAGSDDAGTTTDAGTETDAGTDTDAGVTDAGTETDAGTSTDAGTDAGFEGVQCGDSVCQTGDVCCASIVDGGASLTCAASCPDGGAVVACDGPEDCSGSPPVCCGTITFGPGASQPFCPMNGVAASCDSTCATNIPLTCSSQAEVVLCHARVDCAGQGTYSECCAFGQNGQNASFCVTTQMAAFSQGCAQ